MHTDFLEEQLNLIYIQEDLKNLYPEKIKEIIYKMKKVNQDNILNLKRHLPSVSSYNTIVAYAKKNPELYSNYLKEKRKKSNLPEESKNIRDMAIASFKTLHQYAVKQNHPKVSIIKLLLDELEEYLASAGIWFLTIGVGTKLLVFLSRTFKIFNDLVDVNDHPAMKFFIIIGTCLLLISWSISKMRNRKKKKKETSSYGKNPYDTSEGLRNV